VVAAYIREWQIREAKRHIARIHQDVELLDVKVYPWMTWLEHS
jgi:hypothetical protein